MEWIHYNWLVGVNPCDNRFQSLVFLPLTQMRVDMADKRLDLFGHDFQSFPLLFVLGLFQDGFQQQGVLGQSLHWSHQNVNQAQPIAIFLRLTPLHYNNLESYSLNCNKKRNRFLPPDRPWRLHCCDLVPCSNLDNWFAPSNTANMGWKSPQTEKWESIKIR